MPSKPFKVIIAGGGLAGLTLANFLERVGIDYIILESHAEMAPQVGAGIVITPNGSRVLDQIGLYEPIRRLITDDEVLDRMALLSDGEKFFEVGGVGEKAKRRFGYNSVFVDRQMILQVLWDNLRFKDRVLVNQRVAHVSLDPEAVHVETANGQVFTGDILIGADGVRSKVRNEMWRLADDLSPGYIPDSERAECLPTEFALVYGISIMNDAKQGLFQYLNFKNFSYLIMTGPQKRVYWFLSIKVENKVCGINVPKYSKADEETFVNQHLDDKIEGGATFRDVYAARISSSVTALPEYVFKKWHFDRVMTIGDAAHKFNPINGQGGNNAIETVGVLVSNLVRMIKMKENQAGDLTTADIDAAFAATQEKRDARVRLMLSKSGMGQRFAAKQNPTVYFIAMHLLPYFSYDESQNDFAAGHECGHRANVLDMPKRAHYVPYVDDELPAARLDATGPLIRSVQLATGVLLCAILFVAHKVLVVSPDALGPAPTFLGAPLQGKYTGFNGLDSILRLIVWVFSESISGPDLGTRLQCFYFLVNLLPIVYIWAVEGHRNGNQLTLLAYPALFGGVSQLLGIGKIAPFYFLLSMLNTRRDVYNRTTGRAVHSPVAKALIPALCLGFIVPSVLLFIQHGDHATQQNAIAFWQPLPVYVAMLTWLFSRAIDRASPAKPLDLELLDNKDVTPLMCGYALCASVTAVLHICTMICAIPSPNVSLIEAMFNLSTVASMRSGMNPADFFRYDFVLCFAAMLVWLLYSVFHLRRLGYITTGNALKAAVAIALGQILVGPGAVYAVIWAWRENVIVSLSEQWK